MNEFNHATSSLVEVEQPSICHVYKSFLLHVKKYFENLLQREIRLQLHIKKQYFAFNVIYRKNFTSYVSLFNEKMKQISL